MSEASWLKFKFQAKMSLDGLLDTDEVIGGRAGPPVSVPVCGHCGRAGELEEVFVCDLVGSVLERVCSTCFLARAVSLLLKEEAFTVEERALVESSLSAVFEYLHERALTHRREFVEAPRHLEV